MENAGQNSMLEKQSIITYDDISLIQLGNEELYNLDSIKITRGINEHERIYLRCTNILAADKEKYLKMADTDTTILIQYGNDKQTLFNGVVTHLNIKLDGSNWNLEIRGASCSIKLDVTMKSRSFVQRKLTYENMFEEIRQKYGATFAYLLNEQAQLGGFVLQYQETDWNFLKRIAGGFSTGLVAHALFDKPAITFGVYDDSRKVTPITMDQYNGVDTVGKNTYDDYYTDEDDTVIHYRLTTRQLLNIGDAVRLDSSAVQTGQAVQNNPSPLYVARSSASMTRGNDLMWKHILTPKEGLVQKPYSRRRIAGMSLEGVVQDRVRDTALVELAIDTAYKGSAKDQYTLKNHNDASNITEYVYFKYCSPYTAEQNTGFYCMPEIGDSVEVYFPTENETDGVIMQSIRRGTGQSANQKADKPDVKYFRTPFGKEIKFDQNELVITVQKYDTTQKKLTTTNVAVLTLNDNDGITLTTQQKITIKAENDLTIDSKSGNVTIAAGNNSQLSMKCGDSSITMKGGNTTIKGKKIKTN